MIFVLLRILSWIISKHEYNIFASIHLNFFIKLKNVEKTTQQ